MIYEQDIILELNSNTAYTTIGAKQSDNNSRVVKVHITSNGADYPLTDVSSAYFRFRKPDGKAIINACSIDKTNNIISLVLTAQALAVAGRGYADITLMSGSSILSTVSFIIVIMAAPQVASEAISSNEFGYLNAVVEDATHTIYEAEAWAAGTRGGIQVFNKNTFTEEIDSPEGIIVSVIVDEEFFKNKVGSNPGLKRIFSFIYTQNSQWQLQLTSIEGATENKNVIGTIENLDAYGIQIGTTGGVSPNVNDKIIITIEEADLQYQNNAKYYSEEAKDAKEAIDNLTVTAKKITAEEFYTWKEYHVNDYVWYDNYLYKFKENYGPSEVWDPSKVEQEAIVNKSTGQSGARFEFLVPQGPTGDVNFMTFEIDPITGELKMYKPKNLTQVHFEIIGSGDNRGQLGVRIDMGGNES